MAEKKVVKKVDEPAPEAPADEEKKTPVKVQEITPEEKARIKAERTAQVKKKIMKLRSEKKPVVKKLVKKQAVPEKKKTAKKEVTLQKETSSAMIVKSIVLKWTDPKAKKNASKVNVYDLKGKSKSQIELPDTFYIAFRPDLIRKDVTASRANRRQPYAPNAKAGIRHSVSTWGKGRGTSRVQRHKDGRTATESPNNVTGRRAHPPRLATIWDKKVNRKERILARLSALSATKEKELVTSRGHTVKEKVTLPIVIEDGFKDLDETADVVDVLVKLGVMADIEKAKSGTHVRAGRGKMRGRRYRQPKSVLLVVDDQSPVMFAARNLPGVDIITASNLNTEMLAPGGDPGRLTLFTKGAIDKLGG